MRSFALICVVLSLATIAFAGEGPKVTDKVSLKNHFYLKFEHFKVHSYLICL